MPDPRITAVVERTADPATVAWAHEGKGDLAALPDPELAIAAATALGNIRALQSVVAPKPLRKAAAAALHKLKSRGVKVEEVVAPRAFTLAKENIELPSRAFLSLPDIEGDMELLLTTSDPTGNCALGIVLGAGATKEMRHAHLGRADLRDVWKKTEGRADLVEIPFAAGLHYAERYASGGSEAHDWHHFLEHVPAATLQAARALDPLTLAPAAKDEGEDPNPRWLAPLGALDDASLRDGIDAMVATTHGHATDEDRDAALEALYARTADAALAAGDIAGLARSAELAAAALTFHGLPRGAALVRAQGEAAAGGAPGSSIEGVLMGVRLLLITQAQAAIQDRVGEIDQALAAAATSTVE